jgi:hypothetical protein
VIYQIFGGYFQSQIECFRCKSITKSFEAFLDISVDIHAGKSLSRALEEFTNFHQMNEDNKYHCERYSISSFLLMIVFLRLTSIFDCVAVMTRSRLERG